MLAFKSVTERLRAPEDYELITYRLMQKLRQQNVVHAEVYVSVGVIRWRGQPVEPIFEGMERGRDRGQRDFGVSLLWIFDAVRQFGPEAAAEVFNLAARLRDRNVVGVGIGGDETRGPAEWFRDVFDFARKRGLRLTAHAGETTGPESVWKALEIGAERIGHGIRSIEDPALLRELRDQTRAAGVTALKFQLPDLLEWVETGNKLTRAVKHMEMLREGLGPDLDFAVDFHARPSPTVAAIILREIEPLHLLFAEEICPPENIRAMARAVRHSATPIATGERLIAAYGCAELIDLGVIDILQPDIAHIGGVTALWKVSAAAEASGIRMAPHACEGPIGGIASLHVDAAGPNFLAQEICGFVDGGEKAKVWEDLMGFPAMRMVDGRYPLPTRPGLGIDISEAALKRYPFQGTRPFQTVFHEDGSVASI
jgi:L-alanine-DL-glutamate epimerase-like enolase superfamily enzyme